VGNLSVGNLSVGVAMSRRAAIWAVAAMAVMVSTGAPVRAQSSLSEHLAATISQARNSDLHQRFGRALIDYGRDLEIEPSAAVGNYAAAVGFYDAAIRLGRREATFYVARAEAHIHLDQPRSAWVDYDQAIEIKLTRASDRYYAFLGRGYASLQMADYAGAITD